MENRITDFINKKIEKGYFTGTQVVISRNSEILIDLSAGSVNSRTLFNLESITKVMVTLPIVFKLIEDKVIKLNDHLIKYIPEFGTNDEKRSVTIRDLLNFTGGISLEDPEGSEEAALNKNLNRAWNLHYNQELTHPPGTKILYSDVSCRILGRMLERIMGRSLSEAASEWIFKPLGMNNTMFNPPEPQNCADTGISASGRVLRGQVCQDLEHYLGGILGSDGLFSTATDISVFLEMLLNKGTYRGHKILDKNTVIKMTEGITNNDLYERPGSGLHYLVSGPKTWFWEHAAAPYSFFGDLVSEEAIGKMGGAGTFLLIEPELDLSIVYLTNYGQPEDSLIAENTWNEFFEDLNPMGLCDLIISSLN